MMAYDYAETLNKIMLSIFVASLFTTVIPSLAIQIIARPINNFKTVFGFSKSFSASAIPGLKRHNRSPEGNGVIRK